MDFLQAVQAVMDHAVQEWAVITGAPMALAILAGLMFLAMRLYFRHAIISRDERLQIETDRVRLRDDELQAIRNQVNEIPSEAAGAELRVRLASIEETLSQAHGRLWHSLERSRQQDLIQELKRIGSHTVAIYFHEVPDCEEIAVSFSETFKLAGWKVEEYGPGKMMMVGEAGLCIRTDLVDVRERLLSAFHIALDLYAVMARDTSPSRKSEVTILIGPKRLSDMPTVGQQNR